MLSIPNYNAKQIAAVARVKCWKSLLTHTRFFYKAQYGRKFVVGDPHRIICAALERVLTGGCKRLIINIAPRYGKTELAVKNFIAHGLSLNAAAKFIHLSYSDSLALDNSEAVKDIIQSAEYQALFPEVQIKKGTKAKEKWYTTKNGGVLARAAAGSVTGFGAGQVDEEPGGYLGYPNLHEKLRDDELKEWVADIEAAYENIGEYDYELKQRFGGAIIIDDPIKPEDADSDTIREKVNSRFDSTIRNRVNSRHTPIIVIMQRLHPNDLAGYLQREDEADKWEVVSLPSINIAGNPYGLTPGEALWPFKHTLEELNKLKGANEIVFERQHMQNPEPKTGLMFPRKELHYFNMGAMQQALDDPDYIHLVADPAGDGGDDFAAITTKLIDNRIYVTNVLYNTDGTDHNELATSDMIVKDRVHSAGIEGVFGWAESVKKIRANVEDRGWEGELRMLKPRTNKHVRITARASFIRNNFYFREDWEQFPQYAKFIRNLTAYLKIQEPGKTNKHDEAPDVCEMAGTYYERNFPQLWAIK